MGIMLVYDVTNEKSFENIKNWIRNIEEHASSDVEKMILGNKCDISERRVVSKERGQQVIITASFTLHLPVFRISRHVVALLFLDLISAVNYLFF